ncbi:hypothetical protein [Roseivirga pacifica]|uniref:hypothetical protein n=1 Tax=Roseivirga pacifica TaxID=1267423 RepID=UPI003BAC3041
MASLIAINGFLKEVSQRLNGNYFTESISVPKMEMPNNYEYRGITWQREGLNFQIEIFPTVTGENSQLNKWNYTYSVYFDEHKKRYFSSSYLIQNGPKNAIIQNITDLTDLTFSLIRDFSKEDKSLFERIIDLKS